MEEVKQNNNADRDILVELKQSMNEKSNKSLTSKTCKIDRDFELTIQKFDKRSLDLIEVIKSSQEKVQEGVQDCQDVHKKTDGMWRNLTDSLFKVQASYEEGLDTIKEKIRQVRREICT